MILWQTGEWRPLEVVHRAMGMTTYMYNHDNTIFTVYCKYDSPGLGCGTIDSGSNSQGHGHDKIISGYIQ